MIVGIHQPNYLPWGGYFYKILMSDVFVFLDDAQYTKNSLINRNRIKTSSGVAWLTVPVNASISNRINEVEFSGQLWKNKHMKTIEMNYKKAPYYQMYSDGLYSIISSETNKLAEMNMKIICYICSLLGATCKFLLSSDMNLKTLSDDRLIEIVKTVKGTTYLSGRGGQNYQSEEKFVNNRINLQYTEYKQTEYPQRWGDYEPNLSIIDILFNCGSETRELILGENA